MNPESIAFFLLAFGLIILAAVIWECIAPAVFEWLDDDSDWDR